MTDDAINFREFPKIPRLNREIIVTEKIDGTNASIYLGEDGELLAGSRSRWISRADDNFGFAAWVWENEAQVRELGPGHHFGEWWGSSIQRRYGQTRKRFSLFNVDRWTDCRPAIFDVVPVLYRGVFDTSAINGTLDELKMLGSRAAPGFMKPEGIIIFHKAGNLSFKRTIEKDDEHKGQAERRAA